MHAVGAGRGTTRLALHRLHRFCIVGGGAGHGSRR